MDFLRCMHIALSEPEYRTTDPQPNPERHRSSSKLLQAKSAPPGQRLPTWLRETADRTEDIPTPYIIQGVSAAELLDALTARSRTLLPRLIPQRFLDLSAQRVSDRMLARMWFALLAALDGPIGAPELRAATRRLDGTPVYESLQRMRHWDPAYRVLTRLRTARALVRMQRDKRVWYRLAVPARRKLTAIVAQLVKTGVVRQVDDAGIRTAGGIIARPGR
jgi:hypothetical protein